MGNKVSSAGEALNLWKRDVTPDRSTAHHGRSGTVGGGGICAEDTEVSKRSDVGRNDDDDDDEGRINFSVALSPKTTRTRNNKLKQ